MTTLAHLIRYESPHSGLAFRDSLYVSAEDDQLVADCLALANADLRGRRFLILGVDGGQAESRRFIGVERDQLARFRRRFRKLVAECVEPELNAMVRAVEIDGLLIGYVRIEDCDTPPYLAKRSLGKKLRVGHGYVRRGSRNYPLRRSDLKRMFAGDPLTADLAMADAARADLAAADAARAAAHPDVRVAFAGNEPSDRLTLRALAATKLPSELAAERLKSMLEMNDQARERFGQTVTRLSRLMHTKLYGAEEPFEKHSDDSIVGSLETVDIDYSAADAHYLYDVRAHRLNLMVSNQSESNLHDAVLRVTIPQLEGTGIADHVYSEGQGKSRPKDSYPVVTVGARTVTLEVDLGTLYAGRSIRAFQEPARFWARPTAAGKAVPVDYELVARELEAPHKGSLIIYIEQA